MNCWGICLLVAAAVLVGFTKESNAAGISLCLGLNLGNLLGLNGCNDDSKPVSNTTPVPSTLPPTTLKPALSQEDIAAALQVLYKGFTDCNTTLADAEQNLNDAYSRVSLLGSSPVIDASAEIEKSVKQTFDRIFLAGNYVLQSLGTSLGLISECDSARQELVEASQMLQYNGLQTLDDLRSALSMYKQGSEIGGPAAMQSIEAGKALIKASFSKLYDIIPISQKRASDGVSKAQFVPSQGQTKYQNTDVAPKDTDILNAISEVTKIAQDAKSKGANPNKVNKLAGDLISALISLDEIVSDARQIFNNIVNTSKSDLAAAKKIIYEQHEVIKKRIQVLFANLCLSLGVAGARSSDATKQQLGQGYVIIEHGNDEITLGNQNAKQLMLLGLDSVNDAEARDLFFKAALKSAQYAKTALIQRMKQSSNAILYFL